MNFLTYIPFCFGRFHLRRSYTLALSEEDTRQLIAEWTADQKDAKPVWGQEETELTEESATSFRFFLPEANYAFFRYKNPLVYLTGHYRPVEAQRVDLTLTFQASDTLKIMCGFPALFLAFFQVMLILGISTEMTVPDVLLTVLALPAVFILFLLMLSLMIQGKIRDFERSLEQYAVSMK